MSKAQEYLANDESKWTVRATPKTGGDEYIRLHDRDGGSWKWNDDVSNYDKDTTDHDPATESRWLAE